MVAQAKTEGPNKMKINNSSSKLTIVPENPARGLKGQKGFRLSKKPNKYDNIKEMMSCVISDIHTLNDGFGAYEEKTNAETKVLIETLNQTNINFAALKRVIQDLYYKIHEGESVMEFDAMLDQKSREVIVDHRKTEEGAFDKVNRLQDVCREAKEDDVVVTDIDWYIDGKELAERRMMYAPFSLSKDGVELFPDFNKNFLGMKPNDTKIFNYKIPDTCEDTTLAGKEIHFTIKIWKVKEPVTVKEAKDGE